MLSWWKKGQYFLNGYRNLATVPVSVKREKRANRRRGRSGFYKHEVDDEEANNVQQY